MAQEVAPPPGRPMSRTVADFVRTRIPHADVADDRELLRRALLALVPESGETRPRWVLVRCALGHGSGVGTAICDALGIDPDEDVTNPLPDWVCDDCDDCEREG